MLHGDNFGDALQRIRTEKFEKWCKKEGFVIPDGRTIRGFTPGAEDDTLDAMRYALGGAK
jgi:hypothetical protein